VVLIGTLYSLDKEQTSYILFLGSCRSINYFISIGVTNIICYSLVIAISNPVFNLPDVTLIEYWCKNMSLVLVRLSLKAYTVTWIMLRLNFFIICWRAGIKLWSDITHVNFKKYMSSKDLCDKCHHVRATHRSGLGENDRSCFWPNCICGRFEE